MGYNLSRIDADNCLSSSVVLVYAISFSDFCNAVRTECRDDEMSMGQICYLVVRLSV